MLIRPPDPPLINSPLVFEFRFESRMKTGEFNSHYLLQG